MLLVAMVCTGEMSLPGEELNGCDKSTHKWPSDAMCANAIGRYTCVCKSGYSGDDWICDITECKALPTTGSNGKR